ncbi:MAG: amidase, partial [Pseudomonadota bacterium]
MELQEMSALALSATLDAKDASAVEVMTAVLDRIEAVNGDLNAIVALRDRDELLTEAAAADKAERKGWLHGIP